MKIVGTGIIDAFVAKNAPAKPAFDRWLATVRAAGWRTPLDAKRTFNHVDFIGDRRAIFNIGGNKYRLMAVVVFTESSLTIRWVGTHADYDKTKF